MSEKAKMADHAFDAESGTDKCWATVYRTESAEPCLRPRSEHPAPRGEEAKLDSCGATRTGESMRTAAGAVSRKRLAIPPPKEGR